jgi:hypothetical protein
LASVQRFFAGSKIATVSDPTARNCFREGR